MLSVWSRQKIRVALAQVIGGVLFFGFLTVTAHGQSQAPATAVALGATYAQSGKLSRKVAHIVVYRADKSNSKGVIRLEMNGNYHTSLQTAAYSEICVLPSSLVVGANTVGVVDTDDEGPQTQLSLTARAQQTVYLRVSDEANKTTITPVADDVAKTELQQVRRQIHAANRVSGVLDCVESVDAPAPRTAGGVLSSDDLFGFGKSDIQGMTPQGRAALDELVANIQAQYPGLTKTQIRVVGHADPVGNAQVNQRLSQARANAVRSYMVNKGLSAQRISAEGSGANQLAVSNCGKSNTPENMACNKPNRRVEVIVQSVDQ